MKNICCTKKSVKSLNKLYYIYYPFRSFYYNRLDTNVIFGFDSVCFASKVTHDVVVILLYIIVPPRQRSKTSSLI